MLPFDGTPAFRQGHAQAPALAVPRNFGFTHDIETASSVALARSAPRKYVPGSDASRPTNTPPVPVPWDSVGRRRSASPAESYFTSVTDRAPGDGVAGGIPSSSPDRFAEASLDRHGDRGAYYAYDRSHQPPRPAVGDAECQTSGVAEVFTRRELLERSAQQRDAWLDEFKRQWRSVSHHYGRMINRAERCSPSRSRLPPAAGLRHLPAWNAERDAHSSPASGELLAAATGERSTTPSTSRRFDDRFVAAARSALGLQTSARGEPGAVAHSSYSADRARSPPLRDDYNNSRVDFSGHSHLDRLRAVSLPTDYSVPHVWPSQAAPHCVQ